MARDVRLIRSPISVAGMVLTTVSAAVFLVVFLADLFGLHTNPYIGLLFFLILPTVFLIGLVLIPVGAWVERRRRAQGKAPTLTQWPRIDLNVPSQRRIAVAVFTLSVANVIIVSLAAYRGVEYMDSVEFCGQVCHKVMQPEAVAYQDGPHSRVACVECHIGPGATSFAQAKVSGLRQLVGVVRGNYSRPIPAPVEAVRSATEICEQCHWSEKDHGDKVRRVAEYGDDEANTENVTTLKVHVGGGSPRLGSPAGIHWHMSVENTVEYIATDAKRQTIPYVKFTDAKGNVREYFAQGVTPEQLASGERRRMDCLDCHNRPAHQIAASAERAVDQAISRGLIARTVPFVRREAVKALKAEYPTQDAAVSAISASMLDFYRTQQSAAFQTMRPDIDSAVAATTNIYKKNVFPEMKVGFGTYPSNIGHIDSPGCFRCHDDEHKAKDGKAIGQDCESCHAME